MKRRDFLRYTAAGVAGSMFGNATFLAADGLDRNICLIYLRGGLDGLYSFPLHSGDAFTALVPRRPDIHVQPANILIPSSIQNATQRVGFHRNWARLVNHAGNNLRLITKVGALPFNDPKVGINKSHADCQKISMSGNLNLAAAKGLTGRAHNHYNLRLFNTIGLGGNPENDLDSPTILNLSGFGEYQRISFTGNNYACSEYNNLPLTASNNTLHARDVMAQLDSLDKSQKFSTVFRNAKDAMRNSLNDVQTKINPVNSIGDYRRYDDVGVPTGTIANPGGTGGLVRDAFKYFAAPNLGVQTRICQLSIGGWDTHEFQVNALATGLQNLAGALRGFVEDCQSAGIWSKTAVLIITEFGRTVNQNGGQGTDHGYANFHMALSGAFSGKVIGDGFTPADWNDTQHYFPTISYLSPVNDLFKWAGLPLDTLIETPFTAPAIGLFS